MEGTSTGFSVVTNSAEMGQGYSTSIETMSDDTLDSESFQEAYSTPQGRSSSLPHTKFLKDTPSSPDYFVIGTGPVPMEEESMSRRKRRNTTRNSALGTKIKKGSSGEGSGPASTPRTAKKKGAPKLMAKFYRPQPDLLVPDSPHLQSVGKAQLQGEVPPTPSRLLPQADIINVQQHMKYILSARTVDAGTAECLMDFAGLLDQILNNLRQELAAGLPAPVSLPGPSRAVTIPERPPVPLSLPGQVPLPCPPVAQSSLWPSDPPPPLWTTVLSKKKVSTPKKAVPFAQRSAPRASDRPLQVESLPPRPSFPVALVHPTGESPVAVPALKLMLEQRISPKQLGVKVLACQPAGGNGLLIRTETEDMARTIASAINTNADLGGICTAREPRKRVPQILIYDVPETIGPRETKEAQFIAKLRSSNDLPEGEIRVLFRKKGRGSSHHWVLSMAPTLFQLLPAKRRLHWGFGSLKFREFFEPTRCFKCHRFGHVRQNCSAPKELCSRCPGDHPFKECPRDTPVCRRCRDYNARNKYRNPRSMHHSAISEKCPFYLRECEALRSNTQYVS
ncbi:hypothetical protein AVEN_30261-1 [Araneus ventricosus]|uniref:CCHC-type domain-containing protein n=1 Tax=Araneus ventricosus TaxID=182803 RepID=A0A4Y2R4T1_ARAVE|nr:hypothetical protein AVEN_30261-1 [Araneus ventricosus]